MMKNVVSYEEKLRDRHVIVKLRSTQQCMKSEVTKNLGVAWIQQQHGLVNKINVTLFAKVTIISELDSKNYDICWSNLVGLLVSTRMLDRIKLTAKRMKTSLSMQSEPGIYTEWSSTDTHKRHYLTIPSDLKLQCLCLIFVLADPGFWELLDLSLVIVHNPVLPLIEHLSIAEWPSCMLFCAAPKFDTNFPICYPLVINLPVADKVEARSANSEEEEDEDNLSSWGKSQQQLLTIKEALQVVLKSPQHIRFYDMFRNLDVPTCLHCETGHLACSRCCSEFKGVCLCCMPNNNRCRGFDKIHRNNTVVITCKNAMGPGLQKRQCLTITRVSMNNHAHMLLAGALTLHAYLLDLSKASTSTLTSSTQLPQPASPMAPPSLFV
ncbi:hypothetical protein Tco_0519636 [Tanacetum coccineum]